MTSTAPGLRESATFDRNVIHEIQRAAETGIYDIRGWGAKRALPHFDDLLFLGASMSRYPLEGYRERCGTDVVLGDRHAQFPLHLDIPVTIAGMSFGALSAPAKVALPWIPIIRPASTSTPRRSRFRVSSPSELLPNITAISASLRCWWTTSRS